MKIIYLILFLTFILIFEDSISDCIIIYVYIKSLIAQLVKNLPVIPGSGRATGEGIVYPLQYSWASLVAQLVKNLPETWETWVQSLGWEDPLQKDSSILEFWNPSILAWRSPV